MGKPREHVTITPLGGMGEIGLNCLTLSTSNNLVLVDCGLMFPDDFLLGIDVVIPRFDSILARKDKLKGIVLTHAHEDHIGALPWLLQHVDAPLIGSRFTLALVENKLREHDLDKYCTFQPVEAGDRVELGEFAFNFFPVCHSIIQGFGLGIETPVGKIVHTGDFKIDNNPMNGHATDLEAFRRFSQEGEQVLLMISDSTNIERDGVSLTEREIVVSFREIFGRAKGRIIITLFSSHIQRIQEIFNLAKEFGRKVAVSGKSLQGIIDLARNQGFLSVPAQSYMDIEEMHRVPDENAILLVTGSQGEPLSALARLSLGEHKQLRVHKGDTVIMSSRFIPGNAKAITKVINNLYRLGAEVLYEQVQGIHASGHAHKEELRLMLDTVKPKFFVPTHGEFRHLVKHGQLAREQGVAPERVVILEDGNPLTLLRDGIRLEEKIPVEGIFVDGKGVGDVGHSVIKERQLLGGEGLVIVVLVVDEKTGEIILGPNLLSKGFVFEQQYNHVLEDAKCIILDIFENIPPGEVTKLKDRIRSSLRRFFRKILDRDPVVVPLVMTV